MAKSKQERRYWLSYDLGLRGKYDLLYEWLDEQGAEECGDSIATFRSTLSPESMREELDGRIGDSKVRLYLISMEAGGGGGKFLMGKRKAAPWTGYSARMVESALDA